jgi:hypothetical protein
MSPLDVPLGLLLNFHQFQTETRSPATLGSFQSFWFKIEKPFRRSFEDAKIAATYVAAIL